MGFGKKMCYGNAHRRILDTKGWLISKSREDILLGKSCVCALAFLFGYIL